MAVIEKDGLYQYIDEDGNIYVLYPVTKLENVTGTGKLIQSTDGKTLKTLDGTNIAFVTAKDIEGFATMKALEDLETLVGKANAEIALLKGPLNSHEDRITNLEQKLDFTSFVTDDSVAYGKTVPANSLPYAEVNKIGGMTRKCTNLIPFPYADTTKIDNSITWTVNADGTVTANGTATSASTFFLVAEATSKSFPSGEYFFKCGGKEYATYFARLVILRADGSSTNVDDYGNGSKFTLRDGDKCYILLRVQNGVTVSNITFCPMLNDGDTAKPYEPYFEGLRSAEVTEIESMGANLYKPTVGTFNQNGITAVVNDDGTIVINGTATNDVHFHAGVFSANPDKIYYGTGFPKGISNDGATRLIFQRRNNGVCIESFRDDGNGVDIPPRENGNEINVIAVIPVGMTVTHMVIKPMINTISKDLPFTPYTKTTNPIPEAVKAIDGYGWGINESVYNYVDFENKKFVKRFERVDLGTLGWTYVDAQMRFRTDSIQNIKSTTRLTYLLMSGYLEKCNGEQYDNSWDKVVYTGPMALYVHDHNYTDAETFKTAMSGVMLYYELAEPIITDISDILPDGNYIEIESGGTITMVNEYEYAVPSEITYQVKRVMT